MHWTLICCCSSICKRNHLPLGGHSNSLYFSSGGFLLSSNISLHGTLIVGSLQPTLYRSHHRQDTAAGSRYRWSANSYYQRHELFSAISLLFGEGILENRNDEGAHTQLLHVFTKRGAREAEVEDGEFISCHNISEEYFLRALCVMLLCRLSRLSIKRPAHTESVSQTSDLRIFGEANASSECDLFTFYWSQLSFESNVTQARACKRVTGHLIS